MNKNTVKRLPAALALCIGLSACMASGPAHAKPTAPGPAAGPKEAPVSPDKSAEESVTVTVRGRLQSGMMAIGGETTGVTVRAKGVSLELDLSKSAKLQQAVQSMNGKRVLVTGDLVVKQGVEIPQRLLISVSSLRVESP